MTASGGSCAIFYASEAYERDQPGVVGRQSAGAGFLEALVRYGRQRELFCLTGQQSEFAAFQRKLASIGSDPPPSTWVRPDDLSPLARADCLYEPGPMISEMAWLRRFHGERLFSLCGVTHSVATERVIRGVRDFLTAPTQPWDALVCTSEAARRATVRIMESWTDYLVSRGFRVPESPMRTAVIPLGVHLDRFRRDEAACERGRKLRRELGIADDEVVGLYFGRLNFLSKSHPTPMYRAFELAQRALPPRRLHLLLTGQLADQRMAAEFEAARAAFARSVATHFVHGGSHAAADAWFAADFFVSLTDNVQESFGLTPVEAMAASLPCIVSDWNGYRETVIEGETGFLIPTMAPPPGAGIELADALARRTWDHFTYIGTVAQSTAVDIDRCARAIVTPVDNAELRQRMGDAARKRAAAVYDWRVIIPRYVELWRELKEVRESSPVLAPRRQGETVHPDYLDPFHMFADHPSATLRDDDVVRLAEPDARFVLLELRRFPMHVLAASTLLGGSETEAIVAALEHAPKAVGELAALHPAGERARVLRTLVWLYKFGTVTIGR